MNTHPVRAWDTTPSTAKPQDAEDMNYRPPRQKQIHHLPTVDYFFWGAGLGAGLWFCLGAGLGSGLGAGLPAGCIIMVVT